MQKTVFRIEKMDCSAEEQMVRLRLEGMERVERLEFDLARRTLAVYHDGARAPIRLALEGLGLGAGETEHEDGVVLDGDHPTSTSERKPLLIAFAINAIFFVLELLAGLIAGSIGMVADSLDNLADAAVYGISLAAVGGTVRKKKRIARISGYFQLLLAVGGLAEVIRRFFGGGEAPDFVVMLVVPAIVMLGNVATLVVLTRAKESGAHMKASVIFTSNDILVNLLVIASGVLVYLTASQYPDLLTGALIFLIVANGARRILALSRS